MLITVSCVLFVAGRFFWSLGRIFSHLFRLLFPIVSLMATGLLSSEWLVYGKGPLQDIPTALIQCGVIAVVSGLSFLMLRGKTNAWSFALEFIEKMKSNLLSKLGKS